MNMRSIFTLAALTFGAGIVGAVGLSGCGEPEMYCLSPTDTFAAVFTKLEGDVGCIPPHGQIAMDYYLGFNGEGNNNVANPEKARLSLTMSSARGSVDAAVKHAGVLKAYANCANKDASIKTDFNTDFVKQPFFSIGNYDRPTPDANDNCQVKTFSEASLTIPAMPAVPKCKDGDKEYGGVDAFAAVNVKYQASNVEMKVTPAIQGLYASGDITYSGQKADGSACSGKYRFEAINPVKSCVSDEECKKFQTGTKDRSPTILIPNPLVCAGFKPAEGDKKQVKGICVLAPK